MGTGAPGSEQLISSVHHSLKELHIKTSSISYLLQNIEYTEGKDFDLHLQETQSDRNIPLNIL